MIYAFNRDRELSNCPSGWLAADHIVQFRYPRFVEDTYFQLPSLLDFFRPFSLSFFKVNLSYYLFDFHLIDFQSILHAI